jgi:hypothetical protein
MAKFKFRIKDGEVVFPTDQEQIADALAEVRAGLEHIDDRRVWGGYPDGWPDNVNDEDEPGALIGLVLNLERCTRSDPTWQMAWAIEIAFNLGKIAKGGKPDLKKMAKLQVYENARRKGQAHSATARGNDAKAWRAVLQPLIDRYRSVPRAHPDWKSRTDLAAIAALEIKETLGRKVKEPTISDEIKKIEGKARQRPKAARRRERQR